MARVSVYNAFLGTAQVIPWALRSLLAALFILGLVPSQSLGSSSRSALLSARYRQLTLEINIPLAVVSRLYNEHVSALMLCDFRDSHI
ncbi:hypothetical protein C8R43DRAFT_1128413 [Mycena crocata]|nr:hypothetical protein C8R43DRAFT_1128413 [Mycena crocata]